MENLLRPIGASWYMSACGGSLTHVCGEETDEVCSVWFLTSGGAEVIQMAFSKTIKSRRFWIDDSAHPSSYGFDIDVSKLAPGIEYDPDRKKNYVTNNELYNQHMERERKRNFFEETGFYNVENSVWLYEFLDGIDNKTSEYSNYPKYLKTLKHYLMWDRHTYVEVLAEDYTIIERTNEQFSVLHGYDIIHPS